MLKKKNAKKGLTIEEKVLKVEDWFHHHPEPYVLKELLSLIPKATGVIFQSIPEVIELLVSENRLCQEKIGIQTLIWWLPMTRTQKRIAAEGGAHTSNTSTAASSSTRGVGGGKSLLLTSLHRPALHQPRALLHRVPLQKPTMDLIGGTLCPRNEIPHAAIPIGASSSSSAFYLHYMTLPLLSLQRAHDDLMNRAKELEEKLQDIESRLQYPSRSVRKEQEAGLRKLMACKAKLAHQYQRLQERYAKGGGVRVGSLHLSTVGGRPGSVIACPPSPRATTTRNVFCPTLSSCTSALSFSSLPHTAKTPSLCAALREAIATSLNASQRWTDNFLLLEEDVLQRRPHLTSSILRQMVIGDAKEYKDGHEGHELDLLSSADWKQWEPYLPLNTTNEKGGTGSPCVWSSYNSHIHDTVMGTNHSPPPCFITAAAATHCSRMRMNDVKKEGKSVRIGWCQNDEDSNRGGGYVEEEEVSSEASNWYVDAQGMAIQPYGVGSEEVQDIENGIPLLSRKKSTITASESIVFSECPHPFTEKKPSMPPSMVSTTACSSFSSPPKAMLVPSLHPTMPCEVKKTSETPVAIERNRKASDGTEHDRPTPETIFPSLSCGPPSSPPPLSSPSCSPLASKKATKSLFSLPSAWEKKKNAAPKNNRSTAVTSSKRDPKKVTTASSLCSSSFSPLTESSPLLCNSSYPALPLTTGDKEEVLQEGLGSLDKSLSQNKVPLSPSITTTDAPRLPLSSAMDCASSSRNPCEEQRDEEPKKNGKTEKAKKEKGSRKRKRNS